MMIHLCLSCCARAQFACISLKYQVHLSCRVMHIHRLELVQFDCILEIVEHFGFFTLHKMNGAMMNYQIYPIAAERSKCCFCAVYCLQYQIKFQLNGKESNMRESEWKRKACIFCCSLLLRTCNFRLYYAKPKCEERKIDFFLVGSLNHWESPSRLIRISEQTGVAKIPYEM